MALSYQCYAGANENYQSSQCPECLPGVGCLCFKAPQMNVRGCWANPHNTYQPGCQTNVISGVSTEVCLCEGELCNSGHGVTFAKVLGVMSLSLTLFMYNRSGL